MVPPGGDAQLPAGLQLGARVQQRVPSICGALGPGLGAQGWGAGGRRWMLWGFGVLGVSALVSLHHPHSPTGAGGGSLTGSVFQVWIIANKVPGSHSMSRGTVCHRTGVQPREPMGQGWDYGIGVRPMWGGLPGLGWRGHTARSGTCCQGGREAPDRAYQGSLISCSLEAWSLPLTPDSHG